MADPWTELTEVIEETRWAAHISDREWTLRWVSPELRRLLGEPSDEDLGIGRHVMEAGHLPAWRGGATEESARRVFELDLPKMVDGTPGGREALAEMLDDSERGWLNGLEPEPIPPAWTSVLEFLQGDLPPARVRILTLRLGTGDEPQGIVRLYGSALPARVLALVGRGDEELFERMARLLAPARREAAVLFADLQASGTIARRLPTAAFFELIRALTTAIDGQILNGRGIVGKHAGDGVTGFFTAEEHGSASTAVRKAIEAARSIGDVAREVAQRQVDPLDPSDCLMNVGIHWGDRLFMGQVVTGGRIEVTALGDEVNECARMEQAASDGEVLASKQAIERLDPEDAEALGLDPARLTYRTLAERGETPEKAVRDAGGIAVTDVRARSQPSS